GSWRRPACRRMSTWPTATCATWRRCTTRWKPRRGWRRGSGTTSSPPSASAPARAAASPRASPCRMAARPRCSAVATSPWPAAGPAAPAASMPASSRGSRTMREPAILLLVLAAMLLALPAHARGARQGRLLEQAQAAFASAVRWSDYEQALQLVDPDWLAANPVTDLELERYRQLRVTSYREGGSIALPDGTVVREVEGGAVNRHTQAERTVRWRETWRWDAAAGRWWQGAGLPDFWDGH